MPVAHDVKAAEPPLEATDQVGVAAVCALRYTPATPISIQKRVKKPVPEVNMPAMPPALAAAAP